MFSSTVESAMWNPREEQNQVENEENISQSEKSTRPPKGAEKEKL